jgi:hypothetical protein
MSQSDGNAGDVYYSLLFQKLLPMELALRLFLFAFFGIIAEESQENCETKLLDESQEIL